MSNPDWRCCEQCRELMTDWTTTEGGLMATSGSECPLCDRVVDSLFLIRFEYIRRAVERLRNQRAEKGDE